ncbi:hypothetical protein ATKI12_4939 [Kitasatospora sp. Ki12]
MSAPDPWCGAGLDDFCGDGRRAPGRPAGCADRYAALT